MAACPSVSTGEVFLSSLLGHVDCQAQTIGMLGYQALAAPGSPLAPVLTALLTIFIALIGYRLMLGTPVGLATGVLNIARIGIVIALATSWPAFGTVVYDVVVDGPGQLGVAIADASGLPSGDTQLVQRLQGVDTAMRRLTDLGSGRNDLSSFQAADVPADAPQRAPIADDPAFGWARVIFLSSVVGVAMAVRVTAGILLALSPLFAGLLLFDFARGVFSGWARALVFAVVASIVTSLLLGVQLAVMEPWLAQVLQLRMAKIVAGTAPIELLILCMTFAIGLFASLAVILRLAFTLHLPSSWTNGVAATRASSPSILPQPPQAAISQPSPRSDPLSPRAASVARAVMATSRRVDVSPTSRTAAHTASIAVGSTPKPSEDLIIPEFAQALRRTKPRKSLGAAIRDSRK